MKFKNLAENQTEKTIKILRSDNSTEFFNRAFKKLCDSAGIIHRRSAPYTPQQNELAERFNRTIVEKVRCMLIDSKLTKGYWAEAVAAAVKIINISPNSSDRFKSPDDIWFKVKPNLSMIRVFGCEAMALVPSKIVISRNVVFFQESNNNKVIESGIFDRPSFSPIISAEDCDDNELRGYFDNNEQNSFTNDAESRGDTDSDAVAGIEINNSDNLDESNGNYDTADDIDDDPNYVPDETIVPSGVRPTRRSLRSNITNSFNLLNDNAHIAFVTGEPTTVSEALHSDDAENWKTAMQDEYNSLMENNTWRLVSLPEGKKAIRNKWVFKEKQDQFGNVTRHKARLVAKECSQTKGKDYNKYFLRL